MSCYLLLYALTSVLAEVSFLIRRPLDIEIIFFDALTNTSTKLQWSEILLAAGLSFPLAFVISFFAERKSIHRLAQRIGVTKKFGDLDVWDFMFNSKEVEWVVVRDVKNDLMFEGWVLSFSDIGEIRELLLRDVRVYRNSTGEQHYEVGGLYLCRQKDDMIVELAGLGYSNVPNQIANQGEWSTWQTIRKLIREFMRDK